MANDSADHNHASAFKHDCKLNQLKNLPIMYIDNSTCLSNCSGHGDCYNGVCFCEVEFAGHACDNPNLSYFIAFSVIFYLICATSLLQLILCINSEFKRMKPRSLLRALKLTTQKGLYMFICLATAIRGIYFSAPFNSTIKWADSLLSAYYPLVLSGSSLIVCFWAELFHLYDVNIERPSFLSKSFTGFVLFNFVTYSLLLAEMVLLQFADTNVYDKELFLRIFNSIYAILMLVVVIFFLIYGVQVYFKIKGAFIQGIESPANDSELKQSRFGLVSQAAMLLITVLFIFSDVLGSFWKEKVAVPSRNVHQVLFRLVEIGIALWYPCVLWNCVRPERLWILNPRRILKRDARYPLTVGTVDAEIQSLMVGRSDCDNASQRSNDCWICYDGERKDLGPLIRPCSCKGDISCVHHECLKLWLMESHSNPNNVRCKVCGDFYIVTNGKVLLTSGLTITHWFQTAAVATVMICTLAGAFLLVRVFKNMSVKTITVGCTILIEYLCMKILGFNLLSAYQRAKVSAINIISRQTDEISPATLTKSPSKTSNVSRLIVYQNAEGDIVSTKLLSDDSNG